MAGPVPPASSHYRLHHPIPSVCASLPPISRTSERERISPQGNGRMVAAVAARGLLPTWNTRRKPLTLHPANTAALVPAPWSVEPQLLLQRSPRDEAR